MLKNLVFIDTETGGLPGLGLDVSRIGLTEVAAYAFDIDPGTWEINEKAFLQTYVKPVGGLVYDRFALHLQSTPEREITLDFLDEHGRPEAEVASQLYGFLSHYLPDNSPTFNIWAQAACFDHAFIKALFVRTKQNVDGTPFTSNRTAGNWSCSRELFSLLGCLGVHDKGNPSMKYILEHYGIPQVGTHTALGDAKSGTRAVAAMLRDLKSVAWA